MHPINFNILDFIIKDYEYNFRLTPKRFLILGLGLEPRSSSSGFIQFISFKKIEPFLTFLNIQRLKRQGADLETKIRVIEHKP